MTGPLALAHHLLATGNEQRAADVLDRAGPEVMEQPEFWGLRARIALRREDFEGALRAARTGLARAPQDGWLLRLVGRAQLSLGRLPEAEEALLAALAVDPEDVQALCAYAEVCASAGQIDKARRLLDRAERVDPAESEILGTRWLVAHLDGDDEETARLAAEYARVTEGGAEALTVLGLEALKRGDTRATHDLFGRAARADVRWVEAIGPENFRRIRASTHPLLLPLWPIQRFGAVPVWIVGVGVVLGLDAAGFDAGVFAMAWIAWVVYTWVAPPFVRWWTG